MITISTLTGQRTIPISDVLIHQPQTSWRSMIFPTYRMISYAEFAPMQINRISVTHDRLEQIDLIWIYLLKYKRFVVLQTNIYEYKVFFSYNAGIYKQEFIRRMIKIIVGGCKVRGIPTLSNANLIADSWLDKNNINKSLETIAVKCNIPIEKLKLNYALHFPVLRDLELHVPNFNKIYNSI
ncbi:MAG: hypothetical protein IPO78_17185 [Saprospiraceae bacterium]|nr:hypothetical protein [Saprospiraceae bacterium]